MDERDFQSRAIAEITNTAVGSDVVEVTDDSLFVFTKHEMPDWTIRQFCVVPIFFRGHKFYLKGKKAGPPPYVFRYELGAWHSGLGAESNRPIYYDEDYVADRDRTAKTERRHGHLYPALFVIYPLLGFCPTGFKERVLARIGFDPMEITEASIMLAIGCFFLEAIFVCYFGGGFLAFVFARFWLLWVDYFLFFVLPLDSAIRFGRVTSGDSTVRTGFLEWLFRRRTT